MKYIIEIKPEYEDKIRGVILLGAENSNLYVDSRAAEGLEELTADYIDEHFGSLQQDAYDRGYKDGRNVTETQAHDDAYQRGLEDGKAQPGHGCEGCMYQDKTIEHHPCDYCRNAYLNQWQAKIDDEIKVGDEVIYNGTIKCVVVRPESNDKYATLIDGNGNHHPACHSECKKTGKHFDIQKILEEMKG